MLDFDFDLAAFDEGLGAIGVDLAADVVDAGRAPPSSFPLRGPRWLPANDNGVFRPNGQDGKDAAYVDLLPMINTKEVAVAETPSGAIGVLSQPMANFCMEGRQWQDKCVRVANGECADWRHVRHVDGEDEPEPSFICEPHNEEAIRQI